MNNSSTLHSRSVENGPRPASTRPLWLLVLGILIIEAALRLMPHGLMERTLHARMAEILSLPAPRIQIMGDSVSAGINAGDVADAAGLPPGAVQNYSLPGTSPVFAYYALRRQLAAGRAPQEIIFAPHPANLETPMIDRFIGRFGTAQECGELFKHGVTLPEWLFGAACRVSIAMRDREEFRVAVTEGNMGFFQTLRTPVVSVLASQTKVPETAQPAARPAFNATDFPAQLSTPFYLDPVNAAYIDLLCDLAGARGIPVKWVTLPVTGLFNERAMAGGAGAKYEAFLDDLTRHHTNVTLVHPQIEVYPDNCFADAWHLNPYGALRFSRELGTQLKTEVSRGGAPGL